MPSVDLVRFLLNYDPTTGIFRWKIKQRGNTPPAGAVAGSLRPDGYRHIRVSGGGRFSAHRLAWLHYYGKPPPKYIDHVNGERADNRITNLRAATKTQNGANSRLSRRNTSEFKGVSLRTDAKRKNKWQSHIRVERKLMYLGSFATREEAHAAYKEAALKYFGEFANRG